MPHNLTVSPDRLIVIDQRLGILQSQLHEVPRQALLLLADQGLATDKSARFVKLDHKAKTRFEWRIFVGNVMAPVAIGLFQTKRIQGVITGMHQLIRLPRCRNKIVYMLHQLGGDIELPAQLTDKRNARCSDMAEAHLDLAAGGKRKAGMAQVGRGQ